MLLDLSEESQSYVEDCEVCCNPITISFQVGEDEVVQFFAEQMD